MARKNNRDPRWVSYFPEVWEEEYPGSVKPRTKKNRAKRLVNVTT